MITARLTFGLVGALCALVFPAAAGAAVSDTALPAGAEPRGIAVGPDGALWFTEENAAGVGRMTTDGTVTGTWAMPSGSFLSDITAGPDGRMWFTEGGTRLKVGAITTDANHTITEYATPSGTLAIASASQHLWATEFYASEVIQIDPTTGAYVHYPLSGRGQGVAADAQGNVWVAEPTTGKIARIDGTTNAVHEYTEPGSCE
jgi:virginiamycin B lyase